jgi:glycosyltransferase involved in cell wall biosynthesis
MSTIEWQSKASIVYESISKGKILPLSNGGNSYDIQAALALSTCNNLTPSKKAILKNNESFIAYFLRSKFNKPSGEIIIREPYPIACGSYDSTKKYVGIVHHLDPVIENKSWKHRWYFNTLKNNLKKLDATITVSEYWKDELIKIGAKNVNVIYNSFDISKYADNGTKNDFKEKHQIANDKKLIYIGNALREKGVYEVYEALKEKGYELIMSGPINNAPNIPIRYVNLKKDEYIKMLKACDVTISMSRMIEGWNRIAHESLLCNTPVIGNGTGGMMELLKKGNQIIEQDYKQLPFAIEKVLDNRSFYTSEGYKFVRCFDLKYFNETWINLINQLK